MLARFLVLALALVLQVTPTHSWGGHERITEAALRDAAWLDAYGAILVTPASARPAGLSPAYAFGFKGEKPGDRMTAREILVRYAQEPDWGMDIGLRVSWLQRFMGGYEGTPSQGYFHMYYPAWTVHGPTPGIAMGAAPDRTALFAAAARDAFERGDAYWGFRYLSCAIHYIEDLAQPFHSTQTSRKLIDLKHPIEGTTWITANYHYIFESWLEARLADPSDTALLDALAGTDELEASSPEAHAKQVAKQSHKLASELIEACLAFFDRKFRVPREEKITEADLAQVEPLAGRARILELARPALALAGRAVRGFLRANVPDARSVKRQASFAQMEPR